MLYYIHDNIKSHVVSLTRSISPAMSKIVGSYDLAVIGGGIIGLATARQILIRHPALRVVVLEKDQVLAGHQSKRNSGVVHRGIYYKRGSLKSKFCIRGSDLVEKYCKDKELPYKEIGKLIVATKQDELDRLRNLYENAKSANVHSIELVDAARIRQIQPGCDKGIEAIWSPKTAIVDWQKVAHSYASDFQKMGGQIKTEFLAAGFVVNPQSYDVYDLGTDLLTYVEAKAVVNCAGAYSDYFARITGNNEHPKVVPFKGNYHILSERLASNIKTNIYPVPDPNLPFLGIHVTPRLDGSVILGPTSLIALGYEHYTSGDPFSLRHMWHIFYRSGLMKLVKKKGNIQAGLKEIWRYLSIDKFAKELDELIPGVKGSDLVRTDFCGIRAQTVTKDGNLVDDFIFETGLKPEYDRVLHVRNCPSPAATSSLAIAERIVQTLEERIINRR